MSSVSRSSCTTVVRLEVQHATRNGCARRSPRPRCSVHACARPGVLVTPLSHQVIASLFDDAGDATRHPRVRDLVDLVIRGVL